MPGLDELMKGVYAMDEHFQSARLREKLRVMVALTGIWNIDFLGLKADTILP
mgnify:CR=1 FL=1